MPNPINENHSQRNWRPSPLREINQQNQPNHPTELRLIKDYQVVMPLERRKFIPVYIDNVHPNGNNASVVIEIVYAKGQEPFEALLLAGGRKGGGQGKWTTSLDSWYSASNPPMVTRSTSKTATVSTASLFVRRTATDADSGDRIEFALMERYEFQPRTLGKPHRWRLVGKSFAWIRKPVLMQKRKPGQRKRRAKRKPEAETGSELFIDNCKIVLTRFPVPKGSALLDS